MGGHSSAERSLELRERLDQTQTGVSAAFPCESKAREWMSAMRP